MKKQLLSCALILLSIVCRSQDVRLDINEWPANETIFDKLSSGEPVSPSLNGRNLVVRVKRDVVEKIQKTNVNGKFVDISKTSVDDAYDVFKTEFILKGGTFALRLIKGQNNVSVYLGRKSLPPGDDCLSSGMDDYETDLIHYDFRSKFFYVMTQSVDGIWGKKAWKLSDMSFHNGDQLRLRIDRVNRYLYDVDVIGKNITYESNIPPLLSTFFIGDSTLSKTLMEKAKSLSGVGFEGDIEDLLQRLLTLKGDIATLEAQQLAAYNLCESGRCCNDPNNQPVDYASIANGINYIKIKLPLLKSKVNAAKPVEQARLTAISGTLASYSADTAALADENEKLQKKEGDSIAVKKRIAALNKRISQIDFDGLNSEEITIQDRLIIYTSLADFNPSFPSDMELKRLVMFVNNVVKDNFTFITPPIQVKGNKFELGIQIRPKDTSLFPDNMPYYSDYSYYEFPVLGKAFVSFSSGSFITFGRDFYNRTYDWQKVPNNLNMVADSGKYRLVETGYTPLPIGFSALANVEWKLKESWGLGFSAGVGLTMEKSPRLAYLGGGSMFFGDLRQFAFTAGIAGMNVDRLTNNLQAVHDQQIAYTFKDRIDYYKEFRIGGFMAITYTPFNAVKRPVYRSINKSVRNAKAVAYDAENNSAAAKAKADAAKTKEESAKKANEDALKNVEATKKSLADATTKVTDSKKAYDAASKKTPDLKKASDDAATKAESSQKPEDIKKAEDAKKAYDDAQKAENDAKKALDDATTSGNDAKKTADEAVAKAEDAKKAYDDAHEKAEELKKAAAEAAKIAEQTRQAADNAEKMAGAANK